MWTGFLRNSWVFRETSNGAREQAASKFGPLGGEFRGVSAAGAYTPDLFWQAFRGSLAKFDPRVQIRNPVMFVVWVGTLVTLALAI